MAAMNGGKIARWRNMTPGNRSIGSMSRKVERWTTRQTISRTAAKQHHAMSTGISSSGRRRRATDPRLTRAACWNIMTSFPAARKRLMPHTHRHAFADFNALVPEGLTLLTRRNLLKASLAGIAGLSVPALLRHHATAAEPRRKRGNRSVILLWMTGGPSQLDTWDPKPDRPPGNRGPF